MLKRHAAQSTTRFQSDCNYKELPVPVVVRNWTAKEGLCDWNLASYALCLASFYSTHTAHQDCKFMYMCVFKNSSNSQNPPEYAMYIHTTFINCGGEKQPNPKWGHLSYQNTSFSNKVSGIPLHTLAPLHTLLLTHKEEGGHRLSTPWNLRLGYKKCLLPGAPTSVQWHGLVGKQMHQKCWLWNSDLCHCANSMLH